MFYTYTVVTIDTRSNNCIGCTVCYNANDAMAIEKKIHEFYENYCVSDAQYISTATYSHINN